MPPRRSTKRKVSSAGGVNSGPRKRPRAKTTLKSPMEGKWTEDANFVFFYRTDCIFSQFYPSSFKDGSGQQFNCMEQYMHYHKAHVKMAKAMMATNNPRKHKKYGRLVQNFDREYWPRKSVEVVREGNTLKFSQNPAMKKALFETYPKTLVEASPRDQIWGIGMSAYDTKIHDPKNWLGENRLSKILTDVRDVLMEEERKPTI